MSDAPQRVSGLVGRPPQSVLAAPQPVTFERSNGERLHFRSVESFRIWWDDEQRRKTLAEENAGRA